MLPIAVDLGEIIDRKSQVIKPFAGIYFPANLLRKMKEDTETRLTISAEKDSFLIFKATGDGEEYFYKTRELVYELIEDD